MAKRKDFMIYGDELKEYGKHSDRLWETEEVTITLTAHELRRLVSLLELNEETKRMNDVFAKVAKENGNEPNSVTVGDLLDQSLEERQALKAKLEPSYNATTEAITEKNWQWLMGRRYHYSDDPWKLSNPYFKEYLDWFWEDPRNRGWKKDI